MSSVTPPSFIDDGTSFRHRLPRAQIAKWLNTTSSDTSSAYTGSFIDDGADMHLPSRHRPGFGAIDARFYKQRKRRDDERRGGWNEDIQKAVAGDIGRSLGRLRGIGEGVEVRGRVDVEGGKGMRRRKKDTVTVPLPRRWGTIVIKDEGGRVIVIDEEGEFDSGLIEEREAGEEGGKWIKAATTISNSSPARTSDKKKKKARRRRTKAVESLTPILESEYEELERVASDGTDVMSPTDFFMTGGASGWPSPKASSVAYSSTKSLRKSKKGSPVRSIPGSWPSPLQSPTKGVAVSETSSGSSSSERSWGKETSHQSYGSRRSNASSRHDDDDHVSVKTYSTYKPAAVEDAPDTSSDNASVLKEVEWQDDHKACEGWGSGKRSSSSTSSKRSNQQSRKDTGDAWSNNEHQDLPIRQHWLDNRVKTVSEASTRSSHHASQRSHTPSEVSWDGYERPRTESEVSVVGTGSERSWPGHRASSRHSRISDTSHQHSGNGTRRGSQADWTDSEGWGGSQTANVDGWGGEGMGLGSGIGRGDIDETSEDEDWSSLKIRVRSRRESVGEWK